MLNGPRSLAKFNLQLHYLNARSQGSGERTRHSGHFFKFCSEGNTMMKTDAELSHLWQLAHLEFHFGKTLA
jgi:hypothetical protein